MSCFPCFSKKDEDDEQEKTDIPIAQPKNFTPPTTPPGIYFMISVLLFFYTGSSYICLESLGGIHFPITLSTPHFNLKYVGVHEM